MISLFEGHTRTCTSDTIKLPHVHGKITYIYFGSGDMFLELHIHVMCKAEHINFQFSHVTKFITKVLHWMSFISVLDFVTICLIISEMGICCPF